MKEGQTVDLKSIRTVIGRTANFKELAKDCVAFANTKGGIIYIGIEDGCSMPPQDQRIDDNLPFEIHRKISQNTINVATVPEKVYADNGGEYIQLTIHPSIQSIASRSDGTYFYRSGDNSVPLYPDQLFRLLTDKPAFIWETKIVKSVSRDSYDADKLSYLIQDIKKSERVTDFIKSKSLDEILDYYMFAEGNFLTNLGVLWIGKRNDRAKIAYAPVVQFIKYDEFGEKINKIVWDDYSLNPKELLRAIYTEIPDWKEGIEVSDGLFRKFILNYSEATIRELAANAILHRPYTTAGDIFINLYPDRVEFHNPGLLPIGVTPENILQKTVRRNEQLCRLAYDIKIMEKEGSGFDKIYENQLLYSKPVPKVEELSDRIKISIFRDVSKPNIVRFIHNMIDEYGLKQREVIALGLIAQHGSLSASELTRALSLEGENPTRSWIDRLLKHEIIQSKGKTRSTQYYVNPIFLKRVNFQAKPSLKMIEPHRLRELIYADLEMYNNSTSTEIRQRIGEEISISKIRRALQHLVEKGQVEKTGTTSDVIYHILTKVVE